MDDVLLARLQQFITDVSVIERTARVRLYRTDEADASARRKSELLIRHAVGLRRALESFAPDVRRA